jgi:3-oxoacyl-[acyl-carrier-protein] synthase II
MSAPRDKFGRPIVVVTGMGVVTSLGAGKKDNWTRLTAGESGIRTVTRFPIDGLKTTMAGTVDFVTVDPASSTGLTERLAEMATEEALEQAGIGSKADFPGPLFLAVAPEAQAVDSEIGEPLVPNVSAIWLATEPNMKR